MTVPATLDELRDHGDVYPVEALAGCQTALVLFAAGFHGRQDAVHIADAGLTATCVDIDKQRLREMAYVYPAMWEFVASDFVWYAHGVRGDRVWDVVSLDPPTNLFNACARLAPLWTSLARRVVIQGIGSRQRLTVPSGWRTWPRRHRSDYRGGVSWAILEREPV